jgi:hypothetical protein
VRFSDDDGGGDEGDEALTCRSRGPWQRQRESQRNSKQASCIKATWS